MTYYLYEVTYYHYLYEREYDFSESLELRADLRNFINFKNGNLVANFSKNSNLSKNNFGFND